MTLISRLLFFCISASLLIGCDSDETSGPSEILISSENKFATSTTAGNLVTTAIKEVHKLDIVFYPSALLETNKFAYINTNMSELEINSVVNIYPESINDQFFVGTMKGSDIEKLIIERSEEIYGTDLQVAGLRYDVRFTGGVRTVANLVTPPNIEFDRERRYRVAISNSFYFNSKTLPGYIYRNGLNFSFSKTSADTISARKAVHDYLHKMEFLPNLLRHRASSNKYVRGDLGEMPIYDIQSEQHHSPHYGYTVKTSGIVTALGYSDFYPGGIEAYIQDPKGDGNPRTSDGLHIYLGFINKDIKVGDYVDVHGTVYEQWTRGGLTRTSLRDITFAERRAQRNLKLPAPVILGHGGRKLPEQKISSFSSNLNIKWHLDLNDGIDFWESLESMRVQINNPKVVGFSGGKEKDESNKNGAKGYLNLFVRPDGDRPYRKETSGGGVYIETDKQDYNPMIVNLATHPLTRGISTDTVFNVGELIKGKIVGIMNFEKSFFGQGQYTLLMPQAQKAITSLSLTDRELREAAASAGLELVPHTIAPMSKRPKTTLFPEEDKLTVVTYNIENLAGYETDRIKKLGQLISKNLACPDIINLVEVQDFNGIGFSGSSSAAKTLENIISKIKCDGADYASVNIDPLFHGEGGQPGGNIRVSLLYNKNRVGFNYRPNNDPLADTRIAPNGQLSHNPGRVSPNAQAFQRTRKSIIAEFSFKGERVIVIGNHFNSKLGDRGFWGAQQPVVFDSEERRARMANEISNFVRRLIKNDPKVNIIVAGDFNAYFVEQPMKVLEGDSLKNLMTYTNPTTGKDLIPKGKRYTTNYNGNSQALDYIFANHNLLNKKPEAEVLHINSDFMGKYSDHDPVMARFTFE